MDTSAIAETETFKAAIKVLGTKRILWVSDFAVSEMRGRCVTTDNRFFCLHPELIDNKYKTPTETGMTLVGIELLLTLKESCEDIGLNRSDVEDIFLNNALRLLKQHLSKEKIKDDVDVSKLW